MPDKVGLGAVIHCHPAQTPVIEYKSAGFDHVDRHAEARGNAENSAGILRDVGFIQGDAHGEGITIRVGSRNHL